jgi:GNAT superfamily N-acetyltransferase
MYFFTWSTARITDKIITQRWTDWVLYMSDLEFLPLTPERWDDFEKLFGPRGAVGGCWCMWWRMKRAEFERHQGNDNRLAMRAIVLSGEVPGILAYHADSAIGWCSIAPREAFPVLDRSPVLKRVDNQPVWSVVCFFIARGFRQQGLSEQLLRAALVYAQQEGAHIVEGYPIEPKKDDAPDIYAFTGIASTFREVGFTEVARRSVSRPIMRYTIDTGSE